MATLYYDVGHVIGTYANNLTLTNFASGMIAIYNDDETGLMYKIGGTTYKVPSASGGLCSATEGNR